MVIVDASVIIKWFDNDEEYSSEAEVILNKHLSDLETISVPDLLLYEFTNALATKTILPEEKVLRNIKLLESYSLQLIHVNYSLIHKAAIFSKKYKVSVYDAAYAVLAEENKCDLVTADKKFVDRVKLEYVKGLDSF